MYSWLQHKILDLMKVPPEPQPPDGSAGSARVFRSGSNYYRWRMALWLASNFGALILLAVVWSILARPIRVGTPWSRFIAEVLMSVVVTAFLVSAAFTFLQQRMNYELRWYVVTDRCLRVRSGILNVRDPLSCQDSRMRRRCPLLGSHSPQVFR